MFSAFYGIPSAITPFTRPSRSLSLSWARSIHSTSSHSISIKYIHSIYSKFFIYFISFRFFPPKILHAFLFSPICATCPAHLILLNLSTLFICSVEGRVPPRDVEPVEEEWLYESCPESIQPFWISREPVVWLCCNLAASQRWPYCASVNSHCTVGLVSRQWDAVDCATVAFTNLLSFNGDFSFGKSQKSQSVKYGL